MLRFLLLSIVILFFQGCYYSSTPLSWVPSRSINTWLLGVWECKDTKGNRYEAGIFPLSDTHYSIEVRCLSGPHKPWGARYFTAFTSRVDSMYFLNLFSRGPVSDQKSSIFFVHYQLESPIEAIITPIHLSVSGKNSLPWQLRQEIRKLKKAGLLFLPEKSTFWKKTSEVYWQKNASLESQPYQPLRIPIPNPKIPPQDAALSIGTTKAYRKNQ